jgi:hypothetical protein
MQTRAQFVWLINSQADKQAIDLVRKLVLKQI